MMHQPQIQGYTNTLLLNIKKEIKYQRHLDSQLHTHLERHHFKGVTFHGNKPINKNKYTFIVVWEVVLNYICFAFFAIFFSSFERDMRFYWLKLKKIKLGHIKLPFTIKVLGIITVNL
jgi:hypothetical protein